MKVVGQSSYATRFVIPAAISSRTIAAIRRTLRVLGHLLRLRESRVEQVVQVGVLVDDRVPASASSRVSAITSGVNGAGLALSVTLQHMRRPSAVLLRKPRRLRVRLQRMLLRLGPKKPNTTTSAHKDAATSSRTVCSDGTDGASTTGDSVGVKFTTINDMTDANTTTRAC